MSFVRSQGFADLAATQVPEAQPKMPNDNEEFLDVCSFVYVKDFPLPALGGDAVDIRGDQQCIAKKVRDETKYNGNDVPWRRPPCQ